MNEDWYIHGLHDVSAHWCDFGCPRFYRRYMINDAISMWIFIFTNVVEMISLMIVACTTFQLSNLSIASLGSLQLCPAFSSRQQGS